MNTSGHSILAQFHFANFMPLYLEWRETGGKNGQKQEEKNGQKTEGKNGQKPEEMYEKYIRFKWKIQVGGAKQYWKFKWQRNKNLLMVLTRWFSSSSKPHCIMALHYPIVFR